MQQTSGAIWPTVQRCFSCEAHALQMSGFTLMFMFISTYLQPFLTREQVSFLAGAKYHSRDNGVCSSDWPGEFWNVRNTATFMNKCNRFVTRMTISSRYIIKTSGFQLGHLIRVHKTSRTAHENILPTQINDEPINMNPEHTYLDQASWNHPQCNPTLIKWVNDNSECREECPDNANSYPCGKTFGSVDGLRKEQRKGDQNNKENQLSIAMGRTE